MVVVPRHDRVRRAHVVGSHGARVYDNGGCNNVVIFTASVLTLTGGAVKNASINLSYSKLPGIIVFGVIIQAEIKIVLLSPLVQHPSPLL